MRLLSITPGFYLYLALAMLFLPLPWLAALLVAAFIHECGHFVALKGMKVPLISISLGFGGAKLFTEELTARQEKIAAAAGPAAGALLCLLFPWVPKIAVCAMVQTAFNLLPIDSFDGKRIFCSRLA